MLLIISQSKRLAKSVQETFYYMSILSYGATPHEALSEVSGLYRAALIINPESFPDINDYVLRLKSYNTALPVFAFTENEAKSYYPDVFEATFTRQTLTPSLAAKIIDYANQNNRAKIGDYRLAGFDASSNNLGVSYFDRKVSLTKSQALILRLLLRSYPVPQSADKIIKYAFRPSNTSETSNVRTHISMMNKKMEVALGKRMIVHAPTKGYLILTPEYEKIISIM